MEILELLREWASVLVLIVQAIVGAIMWAMRKSFATKGDVESLKELLQDTDERVDETNGRVSSLEQFRSSAPTATDIHALRVEMEQMRGTMGTFTAQLSGAREAIAAEIKSALGLVERTERMVAIHTEHLMGLRK